MRTISLSPEYNLPTNYDYDDVIDSMREDVADEGGAPVFLATIREGRRYSEGMHKRVIQPLAEHAFIYENVNFGGSPPDTDLRMSRAVLSGMLFGHIANEGLHPRMYDVDPYRNPAPINLHHLDEVQRKIFEESRKSSDERHMLGFRMAAQAMSVLMTSGLSQQSVSHLMEWGSEMVGDDRMPLFITGFGTAMYLAWDAYSDIFHDSNRKNEIYTFPAFSKAASPSDSE